MRDQLVSVNGVTLENKSIRDAVRLLARSDFNVRLEIIPAHNLTIIPDLSQEEGQLQPYVCTFTISLMFQGPCV